MYNRLVLVLTLIAMLVFAFGTAFTTTPAMTNAGSRSVKLVSMTYMKEKGIVFKFHLNGSFKKEELRGKILVDKDVRTMRCVLNDSGVDVLCIAQGATAGLHAGKKAYVFFAGFSFLVTLPDRPDRGKQGDDE